MSAFHETSSMDNKEECPELRRGPWTLEEDTLLIEFIARHGQGRWNMLAKNSGLRRTGKSCRMRWLNYLKPDIKRGDLCPQEQLLILELHSRWGNRWSKIAECLPGRTDNEIKNYWRTRVLKQARLLKIDPNSIVFQDIVRCIWTPTPIQTTEETSAYSMGFESSTSFCRSSPTPTQTLPLGYVSYQQKQTSLATAAPPPSPGPSQGSQKKLAGHSETFHCMDNIGNRISKLYNSSSLSSISPTLFSTSISLDKQISDYGISTSLVADNNISCCNSVPAKYCNDHVDNNNSSYNQMWIHGGMDNNLEGNLWNLDKLW